LLSWNKYMHDTSSLLVTSVFFSFLYFSHSQARRWLYTWKWFVCVYACVVSGFLFSSSGGFVLCEYPPGSKFAMVFSSSSISLVNLFSLERKATRFFLTSLFRQSRSKFVIKSVFTFTFTRLGLAWLPCVGSFSIFVFGCQ